MATTYIVLERTGGQLADDVSEPIYRIIGTAEVGGPEQAIRKVAGDAQGRYAAVPVRNWTEIEREEEQPPPRFTHTEVRLDEITGQSTIFTQIEETEPPAPVDDEAGVSPAAA